MSVYVDPLDPAPRAPEVLTPELALIDPELGRVARSLLADASGPSHSRPSTPVPLGTPSFAVRHTTDRLRAARSRRSRRVLVGVAAATMLVLLLFDVRVEVGERPAAADPSASAVGAEGRAPGGAVGAQAPPSSPRAATQHFRPTDRRFAWAPVTGASGYHVEFFRGATRVFARETRDPRLTVPAEWTFGGETQSLRPGVYRWYVWPISAGRRQLHAVVQASLSIPRG